MEKELEVLKGTTSTPPMSTSVKIGWFLLVVAFAMQGLVGVSVAFLIDTPLWDWHQSRTALALWGEPHLDPQTEAFRSWAMALVGGTIVSWSVAMLWIVLIPMRNREPWAWWAIITSTLGWFFIDTTISAMHGVGINVLFNLMALTMLAVPLAMTWSWRGE